MKKICISLLLSLPFILFAQHEYEIGLNFGSANYLGDIGGKTKDARPFFLDMQINKTHFSFAPFVRYQGDPLYSIRAQLTYAVITGDDNETTRETRRYRNLSFRTPITEFALIGELELLEASHRISGHTYRQNVAHVQIGSPFHVLLYGGIATYYFNPKAELNGTWYALQPLGTEGQGILPNTKKYSRLQIAIPFGIQVFYSYKKVHKLGIDIGVRKTFTDYLDDVSTNYYDKAEIESVYGEVAADLSNRSDEIIDEIPAGEINEEGHWIYADTDYKRGNPDNNDYYGFVSFSYSYKFKTSKFYQPKFQRSSRSIHKRLKANRKRRR